MFRNKITTKVLLSLASLSVVVPSLAFADREIRGVVTLSKPLTAATVRVYDPAGKLLKEEARATNENGLFAISLPADNPTASQGALRIEASSGDTRLLGDVPPGPLEGGDFVHLNVATTLEERLLELHPKLTREEADARVHQFLKLPESVDFGAGIENPYLGPIFSPEKFETEAAKNGGVDLYIEKLTQTMISDPQAVQSFGVAGEGPQANTQFFGWIADKLAGGVVSAIGSQIFGQLEKGIGIKSETSMIFDQLNKVIAQIAILQEKMDALEKDVKEGQYNTRMQLVWDEWGKVNKLISFIKDQNKQAVDNMSGDQIKDPKVAAQIAENVKGARQQLTIVGDDLITHVNTRFVVGSDGKPIQQLFAEYVLKGVVDVKYLKQVHDHVDKYRSMQVVTLALLVDSLRAQGNESAAKSFIATNLPLIEAENVIYPDQEIFKKKKALARIEQNQAIFDRKSGLVFELTFMHFDSTDAFQKFVKSVPKGKARVASRQEVGSLLSSAGVAGRFDKMAQEIGIHESEAKSIKMIVDWTYMHTICGRYKCHDVNMYNWWGNDVDPRNQSYSDNQVRWDQVRAEKGMPPGLYTMAATPLGDLAD